jgi:hypothetical protein
MAQALAGTHDLSSDTNWSVSTLRDFFVTLIEANDKRYVENIVAVTAVIRNLEQKDDERFRSVDRNYDALKERILSLLEERNHRWENRFEAAAKALDSALRTHEKEVSLARETSEEKLTTIFRERDTRYDQKFKAFEENFTGALKGMEIRLEERHALITEALRMNDDKSFGRHELSKVSMQAIRDNLQSMMSCYSTAVKKSEEEMNKRFEEIYEFRKSIDTQHRQFLPRPEIEVIVKGMEGKIVALADSISEQNARIISISSQQSGEKSGQHAGWGWATGAIALFVVLYSLLNSMGNTLRPVQPAPQVQVAPAH